MKNKKILCVITSLLLVMILSSCQKITLINEVINRTVNYEENISILDFEDALVEATKIAKPCVVGIKVESGNSFFGVSGFGSGIIINKKDLGNETYQYYVLTNKHIVLTENGKQRTVYVAFPNNEKYMASILVNDNQMDVSIIAFETKRNIEVAKVSKEKAEEGRFVIAIGNPYDINKYYSSVTIGNVSYVDRIITEDNGSKQKYIQHNAEINAGNSGGGLFNIKGELIGMNTWKIADEEIEGLGFAIDIITIYDKYAKYFLNN